MLTKSAIKIAKLQNRLVQITIITSQAFQTFCLFLPGIPFQDYLDKSVLKSQRKWFKSKLEGNASIAVRFCLKF